MPRWIRTCQECGRSQTAKQPTYGQEPSDAYKDSKCRKCRSAALDYGKEEPLVDPDYCGEGDDEGIL